MTGLVRDLYLQHGDKVQIDVRSHFKDVWRNNPYIKPMGKKEPGVEEIRLCYKKGITHAGRMNYIHFLTWFHRDFSLKSKLHVDVLEPKPDLHLTDWEKNNPLVSGRYWLVMAGGKGDNAVKHWRYDWYQQSIDILRSQGLQFVQGGAIDRGHYHPPLDGVTNLVGQTSVRDLMTLIYHSEGVIAPVTAAMHIAAAFDKPCVVIAGGREEPWWEGYTNHFDNFGKGSGKVKMPHKFLHTIGLLDCCPKKGCWRKATRRFKPKDKHVCKKVDRQPTGQLLPRCMAMITVDHVVEAVMSYYEEGMIPPIGKPTGKYRHPTDTQPTPNRHPNIWKTEEDNSKPQRVMDLGLVQMDNQVTSPSNGVSRRSALIPQPEVAPTENPANEAPSCPLSEPQLLREPTRPLPQIPFQEPAEAPAYVQPPGKPLPSRPTGSGVYKEPGHKLDSEMFDHPVIGGKLTVFVLCYGDHYRIAHRCLSSIVNTLPPHRLDLRVAGNECCQKTIEYVESLKPTKTYFTPKPRRKYPAMREMFFDQDCPIQTPYIVWFDDDTWTQNAKWAQNLVQTIITNDKNKVGLYGWKMLSSLRIGKGKDDRKWFEQAKWFRGSMFQNKRGGAAPNGDKIFFVPGYFWALKTKLIYEQDIPDVRLNHNGGDITIGCQVYQGGYKIRDFNKNKTQVSCPPKEKGGRRGYREGFPWR